VFREAGGCLGSLTRAASLVLPPAQLLGDLDTTTGALALTGVARKSIYMKARGFAVQTCDTAAVLTVRACRACPPPHQDALLTRVDLDTTICSDGRVTYGVAGHSGVDLSRDGLLALEARLGCTLPSNAFASAWGRRHGSGSYATVSGARAAKRVGRAGSSSTGEGSLDVSSVAKALGNALVPEGSVAVSQVLLGFNVRACVLGMLPMHHITAAHSLRAAQGKQDVKLTAGYDIGSKQPFLAAKENAWAVRKRVGRGAHAHTWCG
jgi:hypothetical protein